MRVFGLVCSLGAWLSICGLLWQRSGFECVVLATCSQMHVSENYIDQGTLYLISLADVTAPNDDLSRNCALDRQDSRRNLKVRGVRR